MTGLNELRRNPARTQLIRSGPGPNVTANRSGSNLVLSWPAAQTGFKVQHASSLAVIPPAWSDLSPQPAVTPVNGQNTVTIPIGNGMEFFRLMK